MKLQEENFPKIKPQKETKVAPFYLMSEKRKETKASTNF
jgi:hypothetical protein